MERDKKCIGIIFGGNSNEHDVSISSAKNVFKAFNSETNKQRFIIKAFYINKNGVWFDTDQSLKILLLKNDHKNLNKNVIPYQKTFNFLDKIKLQSVDIWFPVLHGLNGEDGSIHGFLKFTQKPIVGSGILGSALGMDKILMKKVFSSLEIPQVNFIAIQNQNLKDKNVRNKLSFDNLFLTFLSLRF